MISRDFALAGVLIGAIGCGVVAPDDGARPSPSPPVPSADYADAMAHARCDHAAACCTTNRESFDLETCLAAERASAQAKLDMELSVGATYDAAAAARCIAATAVDVTTCSDGWDSARTLFLACKDTFRGTGKKLGEPCAGLSECDLSPDGVVQCLEGVCHLQTVGKAGDSCSFTGSTSSDCMFNHDDFYCEGGEGGSCAPLKKLGDACALAGECARGARCDGRQCVPGLGVGTACFSDECEGSAYCSAAHVCATLLPTGAPCNSGFECVGGVCSGKQCRTSRWAGKSGLCNPPPSP